jgi:transcription elongation factor Elf1
MKLIPNWQDQDLTCHFCGTKKSVKYKMNVIIIDTLPTETEREVCTCNRCALIFQEEARSIE